MNETFQLKEAAAAARMELLSDGEAYCLRPMQFSPEGERIVRNYPDPCEFRFTLAQVRQLLAEAQRA